MTKSEVRGQNIKANAAHKICSSG